MKYFIAIALFCIRFSTVAQSNLNKYKYIVVPVRFQDFKKDNEYNSSTLAKYLLVQKGFSVVYENAMPEDLVFNRCLGLYLKMNKNSGVFTTKISFSFNDCHSKEVFVTQEGRSGEKDYNIAYKESFKMAMESLNFNYEYDKKQSVKPLKVSYKNDVKNLE